jgi:predicted dehydrogenase
MIGVCVVGLGFMGKMHFGVHQSSGKSKVVAICDTDERKLAGDWSSIGGNINDPSARSVDLAGIAQYTSFDEMLKDPEVELVDITLPTYLHAEHAVKALKAGKHVLCEKPIALTVSEADQMVKAGAQALGKFMIAQCIRWWPEYALVREMIAQRKYGRVYSAIFRRMSATPTWGWKNWLQDHTKSGGALIDLHVHDIDYVNYLFGMPQAVTSSGVTKTSGGVDHMVTSYHYDSENFMVVAEGDWIGDPAFPFEMNFQIFCEKATITYSSAKSPSLSVYPKEGGEEHPAFEPGDGYHNEIHYFLDCIGKNITPTVVTPAEAREALVIAWAEIESVKTGKTVAVRK